MVNKEIGGFFDFDINSIKENVIEIKSLIDYDNKKYFISGRQAIEYCLEHIDSNNKVLLPSFLCHSMIEPFLRKNYELFFYDIDKNLNVKISDINKLSNQYKIETVLIVPYFGFNTIIYDEKLNIKNKIIDITQSLYSNLDLKNYDYCIASLRKWGNCIDGGLAKNLINTFNIDIKYQPYEKIIQLERLFAQQKYMYLNENIGEKEDFLKNYSRFSKYLQESKTYTTMSNLSKKIYETLDTEYIRNRRIDNYNYLLEKIRKYNFINIIFNKKVIDDVPLYFPIYVENNRDEFQKFMINKKIFLPIIWPKASILDGYNINQESEYVYENIICIPIDQRYNKEDMNMIINAIDEFNKKGKYDETKNKWNKKI